MRSSRSVPNSEMALAPALAIILGLVSLFAVGGYWMMKPTVLNNPGVAVYQPPAAAKVLDAGSEAKLIAASADAPRPRGWRRRILDAEEPPHPPDNAADRGCDNSADGARNAIALPH